MNFRVEARSHVSSSWPRAALHVSSSERSSRSSVQAVRMSESEKLAATRLQAEHRGIEARKQTKVKRGAKLASVATERAAIAQKAFYDHDADGSGALSFRELCAAMRQLMRDSGIKARPNMEVLEAKFAEADSDGNQTISFEEFVEFYNTCVSWAKTVKKAEDDQTARRESIRIQYQVDAVELSAKETELMCELITYDDNSGEAVGFKTPTEP
eukprot:127091-Prymnesium_polylepis.1